MQRLSFNHPQSFAHITIIELHSIFLKRFSNTKYITGKLPAGAFWNVLTNHLVMNFISDLLWVWIIICSERQQYPSTVKGFSTNSTDWLLFCMISHQSLQTSELYYELLELLIEAVWPPFHKLNIEILKCPYYGLWKMIFNAVCNSEWKHPAEC